MKDAARTVGELLGALAILIASSAMAGGGPVGSGTDTAAPPDRLVIVLVDVSGSCAAAIPDALALGRRIIAGLQPGDALAVRTITTASWDNANDVVPFLALPKPRRTVDAANIRVCNALKRDAAARLQALSQAKRASATDVVQALQAASLTFQMSQANSRTLHIVSDMRDTAGKGSLRGLRLDGVEAHLWIPRDAADDAASFGARLAEWEARLVEAGARVSVHELVKASAASAGGR